MRVLVVGGASSVGSALKAALSASYEVVTAGRTGCDLPFDLTWPLEQMALPRDVDVIIHAAAHFGGKTAADIVAAEEVNVLGTLKLCQAAADTRARHVVFISSIFASLPRESEHHSIYSLSKRHAEDVARFVCTTHSLPLAVLRPSRIYGAGARFRAHQPFLHMMMDKARRGEDILLHGTRDPRRNFIYIDDLTAVISSVVSKRIVGTYSCQHPGDVTYSRIAKAAFEAFGTRGSVRFLRDKPDIPDDAFALDDALYEAVGLRPGTTIEDGLRKIARLS